MSEGWILGLVLAPLFLASLFGRQLLAIYLYLNVYRQNLAEANRSASEAKARAAWCVKGRRDGGYWVEQEERQKLHRVGGRGGPLVATYLQGWRWVRTC